MGVPVGFIVLGIHDIKAFVIFLAYIAARIGGHVAVSQGDRRMTHKPSASATTRGVTTDQSALIGFCLVMWRARVSMWGAVFW